MAKIRIFASAVRPGDKLIRKSDGFLFEVMSVVSTPSKVTIRCEGLPDVIKRAGEKVTVVQGSYQENPLDEIKKLGLEIMQVGEEAFTSGSDADESSFEWLAEQIRIAGSGPGANGLWASVEVDDPSDYGSYWANVGAVRLDDGSVRFGGFHTRREITTNEGFLKKLKKAKTFVASPEVLRKWQRLASEETGEFGDQPFSTVAAALQIHGETNETAERARVAIVGMLG